MRNLLLILTIVVTLFSCTENKNVEQEQPNVPILEHTIATAVNNENQITLKLQASKAQLFEGVNTVGFIVDGNTSLPSGGSWSIVPKMSMNHGDMMHKHSTPILGFNEQSESTTGLGQILFVMPTVEHGSWSIEVNYTIDDSKVATWEFPIEVAGITFLTTDPTYKTVINTKIGDSEEKLILGYNFTSGNPTMGSNEYEVLAFKRLPSMGHGHLETYIPLNDLTIKATPFMPSMGHGSSNNIDPEYVSEGKYIGKVNFSMAGDWQILLNVKQNEHTLLNEEGQTFYLEF